MPAHLMEWLNLMIRVFHLIAGISWIGSSFFFMWLDSHLEAPKAKKDDVEGELWMVHSGGFYLVEKKLIQPGGMPETLHWFKWEATFTWISGFFLLGVVYYMGKGVYLINPAADITPWMATAIGVGTLALSWVVYDAFWQSPLGKNTKVGALICFVMAMLVAWGLSFVFSGRGMFIHIGAMFGTLMVTNVWMRILPAQAQMIAATERGEKADFNLGKKAKVRSIHNNYMTFPVLFIMLSNHFPSTYGHPYNFLVLGGLILAGAGFRHFWNTRSVGKPAHWALATAAAGIAALFMVTAPVSRTPAVASGNGQAAVTPVKFSEVQQIMQQRCVSCHAAQPTDDVFKSPPLGAIFETPEQIKGYLAKIRTMAVDSQTMPLGNKTGMTPAERETLGRWIDQGAPVN